MEEIRINDGWLFSKDEDFSQAERVRLPHTNVMLPFNYTNEEDYQFISYYQRELPFNSEWENKRVILTFDGAAHYSQVFVNGKKAGEHNCGYTAFSVDITEFLSKDNNIITVQLDSRESLNIPPFGGVIDYLTYGGIYRDVWLCVKNQVYIDDIFVSGDAKGNYSIEYTINKDIDAVIEFEIAQNEKTLDNRKVKVEKSKGFVSGNVKDAELWSIHSPSLALLRAKLILNNETVDEEEVTFGFRTAVFTEQGFYLNGEPVKIMGLNRHQSYPYVGYAMPERPQRLDAKILKYELALNAVRTSHYPQSHYFLDECDKIGLLVFTEIPGWHHIGDKAWREQAVRNTEDMVKQYRNHPSVILWGVRINESQDDDELYQQTNKAAHKLDPTRQTGGVRFIRNSSLLEDVYTFNDFSYDGKGRGTLHKRKVMRKKAPYLVSEYNGHMFPTKSYDDEPHRTEHALRHAAVMDSYLRRKGTAGGFGWCMADYNTHRQFGSGDKVCYHGVLDMYRNAKPAAYVYASNSDKNILEVSSTFDRGEYPKSLMGKIYAFTNADSVKLYRNGEFVKEYSPDRKKYRALKHPPILIDDLLGDLISKEQGFSRRSSNLIKKAIIFGRKHGPGLVPIRFGLSLFFLCMREKVSFKKLIDIMLHYGNDSGINMITYRIDAIKNGEVVKSITKQPVTHTNLEVTVDEKNLVDSSTYDVATVRIKARDFYGNLLPYYMEPVHLRTRGPIEIIGPTVISLKGGMGGTYVRTTGEKGKASLFIKGAGGEKEIKFSITKI